MHKLRVLIADDVDAIQKQRFLLNEDGRFDVESVNTLDNLEQIAGNYDVIVLDNKFKGEMFAGLDKFSELRRSSVETKVIIYSNWVRKDLVVKAKELGAIGYIYKDEVDALQQLRNVLNCVADKTVKIFENFSSDKVRDVLYSSSPSEVDEITIELIKYLAQGYTVREAAPELAMDEFSANNRLRKLAIKQWDIAYTSAALVSKAIFEGYININDLKYSRPKKK